MKNDPVRLTLAALAIALSLPASATVLDFESPLPGGLAPMTFVQGATVPDTARVTNQYLSVGVLIEDAALVAGGFSHAASGVNALAGINASGNIDYDHPVAFSFFQPGDGSVTGTTDFFAYSPDLAGGSGNVVTISAFAIGGALLGQVSYIETGTFTSPLSISGIGQFHKVTVDQTLYSQNSGGIMLDLVQFGDILPVTAVPEPESCAMMLIGLGIIGTAVRRRSRAVV